MIGLFGKTEHEAAIEETAKAPFAIDLIKKFVLGTGVSVGATIAWGAFEVLRDDPHDAFSLLRSWGPWAVVTLFAIYVIYDVVKIMLNIGQRAVIAMEGTSVALQQIASKDDRQLQELQTLTAYSAQESDRNSAALKDVREVLNQILGIVSTRNGERSQ